MNTAAFIRRYVLHIVGDRPFSIRDCLNYGNRGAVDQVFFRLVKSGMIIRLAQGIYMKQGLPSPTALEVAKVKAAAFKKEIFTHGAAVLDKLALLKGSANKEGNIIYACSGSSSSFRFGERRILFKVANARKLAYGETGVGLALRSLWQLNRVACNRLNASAVLSSLGLKRTERDALKRSSGLMPDWMQSVIGLNGKSWVLPIT